MLRGCVRRCTFFRAAARLFMRADGRRGLLAQAFSLIFPQPARISAASAREGSYWIVLRLGGRQGVMTWCGKMHERLSHRAVDEGCASRSCRNTAASGSGRGELTAILHRGYFRRVIAVGRQSIVEGQRRMVAAAEDAPFFSGVTDRPRGIVTDRSAVPVGAVRVRQGEVAAGTRSLAAAGG